MRNHRNLAHRPAKPALGNGWVQKQVRVALWFCDGVMTTVEALPWTHSRLVLLGGEKPSRSNYRSVRRALSKIAIPVGRAGGSARPTVWKARNMDEL
jgi:hypothetical protein